MFREAALRRSMGSGIGTILLVQPLAAKLLTLIATLFLLVAMAILYFATYRQSFELQGLLISNFGESKLVAPQQGVISRIMVEEGQNVIVGQTLFVITDPKISEGTDVDLSTQSLRRHRLEILDEEKQRVMELYRSKEVDATNKGTSLKSELFDLDQGIELQVQRQKISLDSYVKYLELKTSGFISDAQLREKQAEVLDQKQRLGDLTRLKLQRGRELSAAQMDYTTLASRRDSELDLLERNASELRQDIAEAKSKHSVELRASASGLLTGINFRVGQSVEARQVIATVIPIGSKLEAEVYSPSSNLSYLRQGMSVRLHYSAFPFQTYGFATGHIIEIGKYTADSSAIRIPDLVPGRGFHEGIYYRVRIGIDQQYVNTEKGTMPLPAGAEVTVSVEQDAKRLYKWILDPLSTSHLNRK